MVYKSRVFPSTFGRAEHPLPYTPLLSISYIILESGVIDVSFSLFVAPLHRPLGRYLRRTVSLGSSASAPPSASGERACNREMQMTEA